MPLVDWVRLDRALGSDPRVVDDDIDAAHRGSRFIDSAHDRLVVGYVGRQPDRAVWGPGGIHVERRDACTAGERLGGDGLADARAGAGDEHPDALHETSR